MLSIQLSHLGYSPDHSCFGFNYFAEVTTKTFVILGAFKFLKGISTDVTLTLTINSIFTDMGSPF